MSSLGLEMSDEEFDLVNRTYPHKEGIGEVDKGIGYLEFVSMLTGALTYVPGAGMYLYFSNYYCYPSYYHFHIYLYTIYRRRWNNWWWDLSYDSQERTWRW